MMEDQDRLRREIRKEAVRSALLVLEHEEGEVWFHPGNNGDLGNLYLGDEFICTIRTRTA